MNDTTTVQVGDGATLYFYSDRHAGTVIEAGPKVIRVQEDTAIRTDNRGMSEAQEYRFERNPYGRVYTFTLRKNGRFVEKGRPMFSPSVWVRFKERDYYYDFSF